MDGGGWSWMAGDGEAEIDFVPRDGYAAIEVDATADRLNIWWAVIRRRLDPALDMSLLARPGHELRIEARVRSSHAPRRFNLHFNTQRTSDFHSHLREFDLARAHEWKTVSMTTEDFPAKAGDQLFFQMAMMDWGRERYQLDVDYVRVEIVDAASEAGLPPDLGDPQRYHPPVPSADSLGYHLPVAADVVIDEAFPQMNLNDWGREDGSPLLAVTSDQTTLLRWDLEAWRGRTAVGLGVLTLTTESLYRPFQEFEEIGRVRVFEVIEGPRRWDEHSVTYEELCDGRPLERVINGQMIIDVEINPETGGVTRIPLPRAVMQRMLDGRTHSLALRPLGPINVTWRARGGARSVDAPHLAFNLEDER